MPGATPAVGRHMLPQQRVPAKRKRITDAELEGLLAEYAFLDISWRKWQIARNSDAHQTDLCALKTTLLQLYSLSIFTTISVQGAYIRLYPLVCRLLSYLLDHQLLPIPSRRGPLSFPLKISIDARKILGRKNTAWTVSFPSIQSSPQSPHHQHLFALANMPDKLLRGHSIWTEIGLASDIALFLSTVIEEKSHIVTLDPIIVGDWTTLVYVMGISVPNTKARGGRVCGWCSVSKAYLIDQWHRPAEVYRSWRTEALPIECIPGLSALHVRYCAMHGCNRMLDNSLQLIAHMGCVPQLRQMVRRACSTWEEQGGPGRLQCYQMKRFYEMDLHTKIPPIYAESPDRIAFTSATEGGTRTAKDIASCVTPISCFITIPTPAMTTSYVSRRPVTIS